ncbi:hypothetical protein A3C23_04430 [Candidatus Roizmanbacteria bacterium RIFCSPHIGHO2_02_FULL_37_13b]|uniref:RNase H type-1 domain-containing protein n=1 Tax=Candidatus Roizmanbacteria bacterium RIFCSPLOWO2_02_FULL_36_11 TaxID=1802071 RepID=A0A1F7JHJ2_9BACT|nr:MAG: hypothetical protein A3C23_04430 [Candidatus Roizmanbacteria bacterium RIFCSPHIGHO2_02_FULL_37_13b]OGK55052.1 MAG: hypothetical protein A3H78_00575 [Candidatus Roizmanbacteria bacterium RIFCSPLOWO2_02_FULL_36_11]
MLKIFTDGGSKGNPGPSAIGVSFIKDEKEVFKYREDIGLATNNVAEYAALIKAMELIKSNSSGFMDNVSTIVFNSDSKLMVNQVNGLYKVKNSRIREFIMKIRILESEIKLPIKYQQIPREKNLRADNLVNNKY